MFNFGSDCLPSKYSQEDSKGSKILSKKNIFFIMMVF